MATKDLGCRTFERRGETPALRHGLPDEKRQAGSRSHLMRSVFHFICCSGNIDLMIMIVRTFIVRGGGDLWDSTTKF